MKSTDLPEIRYLCPDWLISFWQSQMTRGMHSNWLEAYREVRSNPRDNSEICFRLIRKKSNSEIAYRECQSEPVKTSTKKIARKRESIR